VTRSSAIAALRRAATQSTSAAASPSGPVKYTRLTYQMSAGRPMSGSPAALSSSAKASARSSAAAPTGVAHAITDTGVSVKPVIIKRIGGGSLAALPSPAAYVATSGSSAGMTARYGSRRPRTVRCDVVTAPGSQ
jgi:hypothetical protein